MFKMVKPLFRYIVVLFFILLSGVGQLSACTEQETYVHDATVALEGAEHLSFSIVHKMQNAIIKASVPRNTKKEVKIEAAEKEVEESESESSKKHSSSSHFFTSVSSDLISGYFHGLRSRQAFYNHFSYYTVFRPIYVVLGVFRL